MRFPSVSPVALGLAFLAGCTLPSDQGTGSLQFSRRITFEEFDQTLTTGAARLEIELQRLVAGAPAVAREVEIEEADDLTDEESVEAAAVRFEGLSTSGCSGTIVLAPSFTIQFDEATTNFEGDDEMDITCAQFVERVQTALTAGGSPVVEAERPAPAEPQAPDDPAFVAAELKLEDDDDDDEPEVEINVDADNLLACSALPGAPAGCVAVLQVLNVSIALVAGTELESEIEREDMDDVDFEGTVTAVTREGTSCTLGSVTLDDGTVVRLVGATELDNSSGDDKQLDDLCAVEAALAVPDTVVEADGKGLLSGDSSRTIIASELEFETED